MLHVERRPELRDPLLVVVCAGWVDAGNAGSDALAVLLDQLEGARRFATVDLSDLVDLQQTRPTVSIDAGGVRDVEWPKLECVAGHLGRDVVVVHGPEPSLRWTDVARDLAGLAADLGVTFAATLSGMPALASHRRRVSVLATAVSHSLAQEVGPRRADYEGPTGFQTIVQHELGRAGLAAVGLWAQVPHYVAGSTAPAATRALLARLVELGGIDLDLRLLDGPSDEWVARIEEGLAERPDVARLVDQIDAGPNEAPDGHALVDEIERFLRDET